MKSKKRILFSALVLALAAGVSLYAGGDKRKWEEWKAALSLTDAQVTQLQQKFEPLNPLGERIKAIKTEMKALESAASPDKAAVESKRGELTAAKKEWKEKSAAIFRSVLTREQFAKYEAMMVEHEKAYSTQKKN